MSWYQSRMLSSLQSAIGPHSAYCFAFVLKHQNRDVVINNTEGKSCVNLEQKKKNLTKFQLWFFLILEKFLVYICHSFKYLVEFYFNACNWKTLWSLSVILKNNFSLQILKGATKHVLEQWPAKWGNTIFGKLFALIWDLNLPINSKYILILWGY